MDCPLSMTDGVARGAYWKFACVTSTILTVCYSSGALRNATIEGGHLCQIDQVCQRFSLSPSSLTMCPQSRSGAGIYCWAMDDRGACRRICDDPALIVRSVLEVRTYPAQRRSLHPSQESRPPMGLSTRSTASNGSPALPTATLHSPWHAPDARRTALAASRCS